MSLKAFTSTVGGVVPRQCISVIWESLQKASAGIFEICSPNINFLIPPQKNVFVIEFPKLLPDVHVLQFIIAFESIVRLELILHCQKLLPVVLKLLPTVTFSNIPQNTNAYDGRPDRPLPKVILLTVLQEANAFSPRFTTLSGIKILANVVHEANEDALIVVKFGPKVMADSDVQP